MSATMELLCAALFTGHALMMVVLFSTVYRDLPHAGHLAILHAVGDGALAMSAAVQALCSFGRSSSLIAIISLLLAICGFLIVLAIPVLTTFWLSNNRPEQGWQWHGHREEPHSDRSQRMSEPREPRSEKKKGVCQENREDPGHCVLNFSRQAGRDI